MTKKQLEDMCKKWQEALGLSDWKIDIDFDSGLALTSSDVWGNNSIHADMRTAIIRVAPMDYVDPDDPAVPTMDHIIAHELIHCWIDPLMTESDKEERGLKVMLEQAVDSLALAVIGE